MGDRELLELAAKAAGISGDGHRMTGDISEILIGCRWIEWNPLTDDGDALRLAVKLNMLVEHPGLTWQLMQEFPGDEYEQTRRAIVRAAAEIGRAAP